MTIQEIKNRYGIIGIASQLDHAINTAMQVAPTDITVLISGESGVGKEVFPQIIHHLSSRKHGPYIAVNCGAIPEGTIDSELFGHEKGSFTGAHEARKGYFEVANGGTIFLDEVAELPLSTQVRLLRVLETGEFIKVGSSKVIKTNVRIVAASNVNIPDFIERGKFREDLFYRLGTVPIFIPPLRNRKEDIPILFRKFASDFAEKYKTPGVTLYPEAMKILSDYHWPGNIRQLKNMAEQISLLEKTREISGEVLLNYLQPEGVNTLPVLAKSGNKGGEFTERELLYKVLFDMKKDLNDLKKIVFDVMSNNGGEHLNGDEHKQILNKLYDDVQSPESTENIPMKFERPKTDVSHIQPHEVVEESLSLVEKEKEFIQKALQKYKGKRKYAARELGISERTLYRKMNEYNIRG
ncbi:MAG: sigma-54-dependent Fis family transcriptional regulator [Bacteroidia bacterium]|nr:sigma-54-dependent Fis family transcriptional regulator [Bacteroidia bacterium]